MKRTTKKLFPGIIAVLALVVIGAIAAAFLIAGRDDTEPPGIETVQPIGDLQDYAFPDFEPIWGKVAFPGEYNKEKDGLVDYAYSDKYFEIDSTIYNPSLSTMSLCLELSAWASYETDVWAEKTKNARKLLDEIGFEDFAQNDFWSDSPSTESIGVVAAHKELADSTLIALPVRGGKYYNEWGSNVNVGSAGEHTGFAEGRDNVIEFLEEYIVTHNITGCVKIWVVGYSRGGAVANLVAGYLNENELPNGATLAFEDLYCYAFEPPQGSLVELAGNDANHANIHNIVNPNDLVTMVAPVDWDFTRYNSTSRLLPTITTAEFESALAVMLEEYEEILAGVEIPDPDATVYNVSEYAKRIDVNVDPLNFLPGGDPVVDIQVVDDTSQTMNEVLTRFITAFAGSLDGRDEYADSLEADLIYLLDQLMGYETGFAMDAVLAAVTEVMTADGGENLKYVLAPVFALDGTSAEERTDEVVSRLHEVLPQPEGFTDLYGTAATLVKAAGKLLVDHPDELLDIALAFTNSKVMQSHYEEITLAWVRAGDPHYTDTPYTMAVPETLRTVRVNCPVNVEIYDSEGNLVASMIDKVATTTNAVVGCAMNEDGEIIIHLPADAKYEVITTATDNGEVNIALGEYNLVHSKVTRVQNYTDIPVAAGDALTLTTPDLAEEEYTDEEHQGSTAEYHLADRSGETIPCRSESRGSDVAYFDVSVHTNNAFGAVNGGGRYLDGTFAMVEAQPVAGGEFIGWYAGGELVSADAAYRFAVEENISLTAHFSEVALYDLTFGASGGGSVANTDRAYAVGSRIQLSAEAKDGYEFDHWEATAGTVENASDAQAVFIVSNEDAAITAVFKRKVCPVCREELTGENAHAAACGVEEHFSCDGDDHQLSACGHFACADGEHGALVCGHYVCRGGSHQTLDCGHYACDSGEHGSLPCGHYACKGGSHGELDCGHYACVSGEHGNLPCGHYVCNSGSHGELDCGHYACVSGEHGSLPCGHYACVDGDHATICGVTGCGKYLCDGHTHDELCGVCRQPGEHQLECGHYSCDETVSAVDHDLQPCGHYSCADGDHTAAACGTARHYACDNADHSTAMPCGHVACSMGDHGAADCETDGHYKCDGSNHQEIGCGHTYCSENGNSTLHFTAMTCGLHRGCYDGEYTDHGTCEGCDSPLCNGQEHGKAGCGEEGHYLCDSSDHFEADCGIGGHYNCSGEHGAADCGIDGHYKCDGGDHTVRSGTEIRNCGHYKCDQSTEDLDHTKEECGYHFQCDESVASLDHSYCSDCGYGKCSDELPDGIVHGTGKGSCHEWANYTCHGPCGQVLNDGKEHYWPCGHYSCDTSVNDLDHSVMGCQVHFNCDPDVSKTVEHTLCEHCNRGICDGEDHTTALACGCHICETYYPYEPHDEAECGIVGHYVCDELDHTTCGYCGKKKCEDEAEHGDGICNAGA